ncbi:MAG: hypothetical protein K2F87_02580 [Muribaculaceae bacterium]|nr:hypothetical protein [Muribaculaceae bacterium]
MKIYAEFPSTAQEPGRIVWPDSCWLLSDRPLFVPDFAPIFMAQPMYAAKIGRLGKCVAPRFAARYVTRLTAALVILPADALRRISSGIPLPPEDYCFDNAVVIGDWQEGDALPDLGIDMLYPAGAELTDVMTLAPGIPRHYPALTEAIVTLSQRNTLKMGDVILIPMPVEPIPLTEEARINIAPASPEAPLPFLITRFK